MVFVHGCFWHGHHCHLVKKPTTRTAFWEDKLAGNSARDKEVRRLLDQDGWKVAIVWECAVRGRRRRPLDKVIARLDQYIKGKATKSLDIAGSKPE